MVDFDREKTRLLGKIEKHLGDISKELKKGFVSKTEVTQLFSGQSDELIENSDQIVHRPYLVGLKKTFAPACARNTIVDLKNLTISIDEDVINCPTCKTL